MYNVAIRPSSFLREEPELISNRTENHILVLELWEEYTRTERFLFYKDTHPLQHASNRVNLIRLVYYADTDEICAEFFDNDWLDISFVIRDDQVPLFSE
jgi:hypothetical protein